MSYNSKYTGQEVEELLDSINKKADKSDIPTKVSQLENDVPYALKSDVEIEVENGVYAVTADGELIDYNTADSSCLGVALIAGEHKLMIAKSDATDGTNTTLYWGKNLYGKDVAGVVTNGNADGTNPSGYLPKSDGSYQSTPNLSGDFTTWKAGALADFNGAANTAAIIAGYTKHAVSMDARDMCSVLNTFNASDSYKDWYVPACGQLALMYLNMTEINAALAKIGGTALAADYYLSSSENSSTLAWRVNFSSGGVFSYYKERNSRVRFVRDISTEKKTPLKDYTLGLNDKIEVKQDKNLYFSNVEASNWVDSTEYSEYPYQCDLVCEGVRPEYYPEVVFGASEAASGNYAALCESLTDAVRIYSKVNTSIIIPTIQISK